MLFIKVKSLQRTFIFGACGQKWCCTFCKDLVKCEHLFWKRVKETCHLFAQNQFDHKHKLLKLPKNKIFLIPNQNKSLHPVRAIKHFIAFLLTKWNGQSLCKKQNNFLQSPRQWSHLWQSRIWGISIRFRRLITSLKFHAGTLMSHLLGSVCTSIHRNLQ